MKGIIWHTSCLTLLLPQQEQGRTGIPRILALSRSFCKASSGSSGLPAPHIAMALSSTPSPSICLPLKKCTPSGNRPSSVSYLPSSFGRRRRPISVRASSAPSAVASESIKPAISLTDHALKHLNKMRSERKADLCLRIGVKQGGCSGMSYLMDF